MSLERKLEIFPAYDKTKEGYGVHGVEMRWHIKGEGGAVQFVLYTNWFLKHVEEANDARLYRRFPHISCHPQPADIGYHSYVPRYEGQTPMRNDCHLLNGPCYYDGSSLNAENYYQILVQQGGEALWEALEKFYQEELIDRPAYVETKP